MARLVGGHGPGSWAMGRICWKPRAGFQQGCDVIHGVTWVERSVGWLRLAQEGTGMPGSRWLQNMTVTRESGQAWSSDVPTLQQPLPKASSARLAGRGGDTVVTDSPGSAHPGSRPVGNSGHLSLRLGKYSRYAQRPCGKAYGGHGVVSGGSLWAPGGCPGRGTLQQASQSPEVLRSRRAGGGVWAEAQPVQRACGRTPQGL